MITTVGGRVGENLDRRFDFFFFSPKNTFATFRLTTFGPVDFFLSIYRSVSSRFLWDSIRF